MVSDSPPVAHCVLVASSRSGAQRHCSRGRQIASDVGSAPLGANMADHARSTARREFLRFLVASPYVAALGGAAAFLQQRSAAHAIQNAGDAIASPADALNVLDF